MLIPSRSLWLLIATSLAWISSHPEWAGVDVREARGLSGEALKSNLQKSKVRRVVLTEVAFGDEERVPMFAEHRVGDAIPAALTGKAVAVKRGAKHLEVDSDGDGKFDLRVTRAQVIEVGDESERSPVLMYPKQGEWYACAGRAFRGKIGRAAVLFLDLDLDGKLSAGKDLVRIGTGAFGLHQKGRQLWTGSRVVTYEIVEKDGHLVLEWHEPASAKIKDSRIRKAFQLINGHRNSAGLQALLPDAKSTDACKKHIAYLNRHFAVRHQTKVTAKELDGPHSEDPAKKGYTKEGAQAAQEGSIGQSGNPVHDYNPGLWSTALHRQAMLSRLSAQAGIAYGGNFSITWIRDWFPMTPTLPVFVPAPGQQNVLTDVYHEIPEPEKHADYYKQPRGFPISVTYLDSWTDVEIRLFYAKTDRPVQGEFFSPTKPVHSARPANMRALIFIADHPLKPKTWYRATLTGKHQGKPRTYHWGFRTRS